MTKSTRKYEGSELQFFETAENWKNYFSKKISPYISGNVLEVGAGLGANSVYLQNLSCSSWTAVEPDKKLSTMILENYIKVDFPLPYKVINGFISSLDIKESFDTILYIDVLEHIEDDRAELKQATQLLKFGGHIVSLSPAFQYLYSPFDKEIGHHRRYNKETISGLSRDLPLVQQELYFLDSLGALASLVNKWFLKKTIPSISDIKLWDSRIVPVSMHSDKLFSRIFGKSIISVWQKNS